MSEKEIRIRAANDLLQNPLYLEIMDFLEKKYLNLIKESDFKERDLRDLGYAGLKIIDEQKKYLQFIVKSGKFKNILGGHS